MSDYTYVTLHGKWSKYEGELPGFVRFEIDLPGKNFPVKASTKKQETVDAMMAVRDMDATFNIAEKDSANINPHTNQPYKDRYINSVEAGFVGEQTQPAHPASTGGETQKDLHPDAVERIWVNHIHDVRARAWDYAVTALRGNIVMQPTGEDAAAKGTMILFGQLKLLQQLILDDILKGAPPEHGEPGGEVPEDLRDIPF